MSNESPSRLFRVDLLLYNTSTKESICNSCNTGTSGLPDMYTQGLRAEGVHIRQATSAHVTANM